MAPVLRSPAIRFTICLERCRMKKLLVALCLAMSAAATFMVSLKKMGSKNDENESKNPE